MNTSDGTEPPAHGVSTPPTDATGDRSARVRVVVLTGPDTPPPPNEAALRELADVTVCDAAGLGDALNGAQVLFVWDFFSGALRNAWPSATDLRWVHVAAAGVDAVLFEDLRRSDVVVTNAHGVFDQPIAEFVAACVLAHDKLLHESKALQRERTWRHREPRRTAGSRALVVGTGGIGRATARLLRTLGVEVTGAGRRARDQDPDFGVVVPSGELAAHVGDVDHLVLAAPLTPHTRGILGPEVVAALPARAHVVNVGRGALVDERSLIEALNARTLAAASLDVFAVEPLPGDHPFWTMDNVHISPHMCGDVAGWREELSTQFEANLRRFLAGAELANQVDKVSGFVPGDASTLPVEGARPPR